MEGGEQRYQKSPIHLLNLLRNLVIADPQNCRKHKKFRRRERGERSTNAVLSRIIYRNIQELEAAGIRVKRNKSRIFGDISFHVGWLGAELMLPDIIVDDNTAPMFLNLIAYEMCPDFLNNYEVVEA
ncbi:unnamed protein product [Sphenostylis stenocarpa]|uniref:Uncharacterized protein n=1 Tax=Sphenostylis stenocarpa TaxID=92480 RepID=A0AA86SPW0_9FABA|nr:unnamed protein product [Sphenostylis stenocarpa]